MNRPNRLLLVAAAAVTLLAFQPLHPALAEAAGHAQAGEDGGATYTAGDIAIAGAFARATLPRAPVGAGYLTITNGGSAPDRLVAARSEAAELVQLHQMAVVEGEMKMSALPDGIEIPAGVMVELAPGGLHIMFVKLRAPFVEGEKVPVTLVFETAGEIELELVVKSAGAAGPHPHQ